MNAVAREFALDMAESSYEPTLIQHVPGVANAISDVLSRKCDPKYSNDWRVPEFLIRNRARQTTIPARPAAWWRAQGSPGKAKVQGIGKLTKDDREFLYLKVDVGDVVQVREKVESSFKGLRLDTIVLVNDQKSGRD